MDFLATNLASFFLQGILQETNDLTNLKIDLLQEQDQHHTLQILSPLWKLSSFVPLAG